MNDARKRSKKSWVEEETYKIADESQSATSFPLELHQKFAKV
jgi:hypothetical protein